MDDNSKDRLTLAQRFLEPSNSTHRQYEALRAFFVDGVPSAEAATRFGYTPGSFRVLVHQFRNQRSRDFFIPTARESRPPGKQKRLREQVVALRKQNLSVHDISRALAREGESLSPAAVAAILREEGFAKLPRRLDDERPERTGPVVADVADVRQLDLTPRAVHTDFGGLFLFLPNLVSANLPALLARSGFPGSKMIPAGCAMRSLLALKLFGNARHSHVMSSVLDDGLALFAGLRGWCHESKGRKTEPEVGGRLPQGCGRRAGWVGLSQPDSVRSDPTRYEKTRSYKDGQACRIAGFRDR